MKFFKYAITIVMFIGTISGLLVSFEGLVEGDTVKRMVGFAYGTACFYWIDWIWEE